MVSKQNNQNRSPKHEHTPLFIGMLHGVVGSALILALLPNMIESKFLFHIDMFSVGCLIGMFWFGIGDILISY